jgi:hypothetical protein
MYRKCFNDIYTMNIKNLCPLNCLNRGVCKEEIGCVCKPPFIEHDCSLKIKCQQECNEHGLCHSNGKCGCYSGWSGLVCDKAIPCLHNCTSEMNGICQPDSTCKCKPEYTGSYCQERKGSKDNDMMKRIIEKNQKKLDHQERKMNNRSKMHLNQRLIKLFKILILCVLGIVLEKVFVIRKRSDVFVRYKFITISQDMLILTVV